MLSGNDNKNNITQTEDASTNPRKNPELASLFDLPPEIIANIPAVVTPPGESIKIKATLSGTCKSMCVLFKPQLELAKAFQHAVRAETADIAKVVEMIKANPQLLKLIQQNKVVTRGGIVVAGVTLYQFFIGGGDPWAAEQIQPYFADLPNGENERKSQYEPYQPAIEKLARQFKEEESTDDLKPLIALIITSADEDIKAALNKKWDSKSELNEELKKFRDKVNLINAIIKTVGMMHYEHYATLLQVLNLLWGKWKELRKNYTNQDKCHLVWQQLGGYLQLSLPQVDFFGFVRAFEDKERTTKYKYGQDSFPDHDVRRRLDFTGLGFDDAILGGGGGTWGVANVAWSHGFDPGSRWKAHGQAKISSLYELIQPQPKQPRPAV